MSVLVKTNTKVGEGFSQASKRKRLYIPAWIITVSQCAVINFFFGEVKKKKKTAELHHWLLAKQTLSLNKLAPDIHCWPARVSSPKTPG